MSKPLLAILLTALPSTALAAPIEKHNPSTVAKPLGAYSHVAIVPAGTRLFYLAGQVGNRPDGSMPATVEEQLVQALENVRLILAAEGAQPERIVKMTIYAAAKPKDWKPIVAKRAEMFRGTEPPPSTWLYVSGLSRPEHLVEVEAIAALP